VRRLARRSDARSQLLSMFGSDVAGICDLVASISHGAWRPRLIMAALKCELSEPNSFRLCSIMLIVSVRMLQT